MSYIWENNNTQRQFIIDSRSMGGAIEAQMAADDNLPVYVNPFLRFSDVFSDVFFSGVHLDNETLNAVTHYLALSERLYGDILKNTRVCCIEKDIVNNHFGETIRMDYLSLTIQHQKMIVHYLLEYQQNGERTELFNEAFMSFFGRLYQTISGDEHFDDKYTSHSAEIIYNRSRNAYYYYCAAPESAYNTTLFRLIKNLFADCTRLIVPVWGKYDFGIVGNEDLTHSTVPIVGQTQLI
ncbi:hypothetical protein [Ruminococcus flavefaciens]|uniref:hypothetical protein n=1 Tax=Ruminococcus flavefaciens TaxID=1265 RepID=UPI00048D3DAE|nr:hypothetical protein [Ruminococcus flavefaciens]